MNVFTIQAPASFLSRMAVKVSDTSSDSSCSDDGGDYETEDEDSDSDTENKEWEGSASEQGSDPEVIVIR